MTSPLATATSALLPSSPQPVARHADARSQLAAPVPASRGPEIAAGSCVAAEEATTLAPSAVRLSQSSVSGVSKIAESMRADGWVGDPIDVVRMPDGGLTTIDNTRVVAANPHRANRPALVRCWS